MSDEEFLPLSPVSVAITGKLSVPRAEAARLINASKNAQFVDSVTYRTDYLVSAIDNSNKVKKARQIGVEVLTEDQLFEYLKAGTFPRPQAHEYVRPAPPPFEVEWTEKFPTPRHVLIKYRDAQQRCTERVADVFAIGQSPAGAVYLSVLDGEGFKALRAERIIEMVEISAAATS
jgi:hypothetical protein